MERVLSAAPDPEEIRRGILALHRPEEIVEIRSIDPRPALSGYFRADSPRIAEELKRYPGRTFYQTLNRINSACYSRDQHERLLPAPKATTSDSDIDGYQWILIDTDPVRPSGVSASAEEKEHAHRVSAAVYTRLKKLGFCEPVIADSGNGYHLLYSVQAEKGSREDIAAFLKVLDMWFSTEQAQVDTSVSNPSRITKLYGTVARKGAGTPERPHRMSRLLRVPEEIRRTPMDLVRRVADELKKLTAPAAPAARSAVSAPSAPFDMDAFLAEHGIGVARVARTGGLTKYILRECPFNPAHKAPDAAVFVMPDGSLGFKCFHNSCADHTWHDFRALVDPQAYANSVFRSVRPAPAPAGIRVPSAEPAAPAPEKKSPEMLNIADIEDYDRSGVIAVRSRLERLDELIGGFNKGELSVWSGANSSGKSTLVSQLGLEAVHQGFRVAMFSGEMQPKLVKYWLYLQAAGRDQVEPDPLSPRHCRLKAGVKEKLNALLSGSFALYNNDYGNSWETVAAVIFDWVRQQKSDVVIIDNLMALNLSGGAQDKNETQSRIVQTLSLAARQLNVHIHFICHPRKTESFLRKNDISGTGDLTNAADNVFMVHRVNRDFISRVREVYPRLTVPEDAGNAVEIMKNRDLGVADQLIFLYYDKTCKTMTDVKGSRPGYAWMEGFTQVDMSGDPAFPFK